MTWSNPSAFERLRSSGKRQRTWEPPDSGRDLPVWLVLLIVVWIEVSWDVFAWTFLGPDAVSWKYTRIASEALIQGVPQSTVAIGLTLSMTAWLGWWRGVGLAGSRRSSPMSLLLLLSAAVFATTGGWRAAQIGIEPTLMAAMLVYYVFQPTAEELLYRGFLLHGLTRRIGAFGAILLSSALFALVHFVPWGWPPTSRSFGLLLGFGVVMSALRIITGSIWYPVVFHALYNFSATTYGWLDHRVPEYTAMWYWRRSIGVVGEVTIVAWFAGIVLLAWVRIMDRLTSSPDRETRPPTIRRS